MHKDLRLQYVHFKSKLLWKVILNQIFSKPMY